MPETSHILGIDFGTAKIGLATADQETRLAFAYGKLVNNSELLEKIGGIIKEKNINIVIIGRPTHKIIADTSGITQLGEAISKKYGIRVEYQEEMFTTKMAEENLKAVGFENIQDRDDAEAARIILQSWLDRQEFAIIKANIGNQ